MNLTVLEHSSKTQAANQNSSEETNLSLPPLPESPVVRISSSGLLGALSLRELWSFRELLYFLTWRDLKVRYKQTALGAVWVVMQPLLATAVFTFFLGKLARIPSDNIPYPVFAYAGMWAWTFFSNSIASSSNSIVGNAHLITKVYFPRLIIPVGAVVARFIDFAITSSVLVVLMIYFGVAPTWNILMLPVLIGLLTLLAFSIGVLLSSFNVKYRDVGALLPVVLQLWTFASPILYPLSLVPDKWRWIYILNPVVGIVENLRASLFGGELNLFALSVSTAITIILFLISIPVFQRMEQGFADVI